MSNLAETSDLIGEVAVTAERALYPENGNGNGNGKRLRRACAITAVICIYIGVQWYTTDRIFRELHGLRTDMGQLKAGVADVRDDVNRFHAKYERDVDAVNRIHRDLWRAMGQPEQFEAVP